MQYKKQVLGLFITTTTIFALIVALGELFDSQCNSAVGFFDDLCHNSSNIQLFTQPIALLSLSLIIILPPLYFFRGEIYLAWRKFTLWYLPIVAILLIIARPSGGGMSFGFDRESLSFHFSAYFVIVSLVIIAVKSWKLRGK
ncbi:MAG: hypothetical protein WCT49_00615 [Candidatus Paceibacterota bacterium]|jgi:hypothetical protein|nr:hypothetical protein [Candidatus Paceibacterota bacterium]